MKKDITIFFVKPHIISKRNEIFKYYEEYIENPEDFNIIFRERFLDTPQKFWEKFYAHMEEDYPNELEKMAREFAAYNTGIDLAIIEGKDIAKRTKRITGRTRYEDNPAWTIRGYFGPYKLPHTIVHASDKEQVPKELKILKYYFPILKDYFPIHISL